MNTPPNDHQLANKSAVKATLAAEQAFAKWEQDPTEENLLAHLRAELYWERSQARRKREQFERKMNERSW